MQSNSHGTASKSTAPASVEGAIAARAARQHGVITAAQLCAMGLGRGAIIHRLTNGRLHRIHAGVYGVGYLPTAQLPLAMAAVLACGPGAALSHRSAAAMWDITGPWRGSIDVIAPGRRRVPGINVHQTRSLPRDETTKLFDIPVTIVPRTLIDLADVLDDRRLARAANEALVRRLMTREAFAEMLAAAAGRRTSRLAAHTAKNSPTRSVLERRFLRFLEEYGFPRPLVNQVVAGYEVDAHWPAQRLVAELDGRASHDTPARFESDRERDADLQAAGYRVIRITWERLTTAPAREAARLRKLLGAPAR